MYGYLHLKITYFSNAWHCAEIYSRQSFGYGEYRFKVATDLNQPDTNTVGGLFTYLDDDNEIDVEFVRAWTGTNNVGYTTQPPRDGNYYHFHIAFTEGNYSTHRFVWETNLIFFQSYHGHADAPHTPDHLIAEWNYTSNSIPIAGDERVHLNMWLFQGRTPTDTEQPIITWTSEPNKSYRLERTLSLPLGFNPVVSNIAATPPANTHTDTTVNAEALIFYRVAVE